MTWTKLNFWISHVHSLSNLVEYEAITPAVDLSRLGDRIRNFLLGHGTRLDVLCDYVQIYFTFLRSS